MKRAVLRCCVVSLLLCTPAGAMELVANGSMEQPLTDDWQQAIAGAGTISRATTFDGDENFEVQVRKTTGPGSARLSQIVSLPSLDVDVSVSLAISAMATGDAWSAATFRLSFVDYYGFALGHINICARAARCPWNDTLTEHYTEVSNADWHDYTFNLEDELANLPGIDPELIAAAEVTLYCLAADC